MVDIGIAQELAANAGVRTHLGTPPRIYPCVPPEDPKYPCATYSIVGDPREYALNKQKLGRMRIQIKARSGGAANASYLDARNAHEAIRACLEFNSGRLPDGTFIEPILVENAQTLFDEAAREYVSLADYLVTYHPA